MHLFGVECSVCYCSDEEVDYHKIFGSSESSDSDFEKFIANAKQSRRRRRLSQDETTKGRTKVAKARLKKRRDRKKPKAASDDDDDDDDWDEKSPTLNRDKENLMGLEGEGEGVEVVKPLPPKPRFKRRPAIAEHGVLEAFLTGELDREDVQMFKLALARLKGEQDSLLEGVVWAHYPHNILLWSCMTNPNLCFVKCSGTSK